MKAGRGLTELVSEDFQAGRLYGSVLRRPLPAAARPQSASGTALNITVVVNWFEELRRLAPRR